MFHRGQYLDHFSSISSLMICFSQLESEDCNFADDTTIYTFGEDIEDVVLNFEEDLSQEDKHHMGLGDDKNTGGEVPRYI